MAAISVLMAVYNVDKYLKQAVDSILNQTWEDYEFIIVDDGSTDDSLKILNNYHDSRIRIVSCKENCGVAHARNIGLTYCTSEYIAIMDADDIALPERLEISYKFLREHMDIDGVYGRLMHLHADGTLHESSYPMISDDYKYIKAYMILNNTISNLTAMFRRQIVEKHHLRYDETWKIASDYKFWCDYLKYGKIVGIDKVLCYYRLRNHSLYQNASRSSQKEAEQKIKLYNIEQYGLQFSEKEKEILLRTFGAYSEEIASLEEMTMLYKALLKIAEQADENKWEFAEEVRVMCKNRFLEKIQKSNKLWSLER